MSLIYEPRGKAREYSPLALNYFNGCPNGCKYCYVPAVLRIGRDEHTARNGFKKSFSLEQVEKEARKLEGTEKPIFLSFTHDPYPKWDDKNAVTRDILKILLKYKLSVIILSKGGTTWLRDIDIFKQFGSHIKVGATLTFADAELSRKHEPYAALPQERFSALKTLHEEGISTWASIEPVIIPEQSLDCIKQTMGFVDEYKVGKISGGGVEPYATIEHTTDWNKFLEDSLSLLRENGKRFYVKQELRKLSNITLKKEECDLSLFDVF